MILENLPRTPSVSFKVFLAAAMLPLLLAGCTAPAAPEAGDRVSASAAAKPVGDLLADQGLAGLDARAIVDKLDAIASRRSAATPAGSPSRASPRAAALS